jgi:hypothetical protein
VLTPRRLTAEERRREGRALADPAAAHSGGEGRAEHVLTPRRLCSSRARADPAAALGGRADPEAARRATIKAEREYKKVVDWQKKNARMGINSKQYKRWHENYQREILEREKEKLKEAVAAEKDARRRDSLRVSRQPLHLNTLTTSDVRRPGIRGV